MYPSFVIGRTVAGTWNYLTPAPVRRSEANEVQDAAKKAGGVHDGVAYVEVAVYDVPRPSQVERFTPPRAAESAAASASSEKASTTATPEPTGHASVEASGTGELSQAAKPGLGDALAPDAKAPGAKKAKRVPATVQEPSSVEEDTGI